MKDYFVYVHTTPSKKHYVGITCQPPVKRWGHGKNYKNNEHFYNAIQKYGWDNISHEVVAEGLSKEDASLLEMALIEKYNSHDPRFGYNLTTGGEHYEFSPNVITRLKKPKKISEAERAKMRERGRLSWSKNLKDQKLSPEAISKMAASKRGRKMSAEGKANLSISMHAHWEQAGGFSDEHREKLSIALKGRTYSKETLERMKASKQPDKNPRSRAVLQIQDNEVVARYPSARDAMRKTGVHYTSIVRVCNGTRGKTAGGFSWRYA